MARAYKITAWAGVLLALVVIGLGAWVRLTHAGLGCPDWPGCYGEITWPKAPAAIAAAEAAWPERPFDSGKAWREMLHRYVAGALLLLLAGLAFLAWRNRERLALPLWTPLGLIAIGMGQALLGMWTVTLKLKPIIVMAHLLGGMTIFVLLLWVARRATAGSNKPPPVARGVHLWIWIAVVVVALQTALGGWVSTNYASLACTGFPGCQQAAAWPDMDFDEGFVLWREIGVDYEGGILDASARAAIHMTHRIGALIVTAVLLGLIFLLARGGMVVYALGVTALLGVQLMLGLVNVLAHLPLWVAVAHNLGAALLLGTLILCLERSQRARI